MRIIAGWDKEELKHCGRGTVWSRRCEHRRWDVGRRAGNSLTVFGVLYRGERRLLAVGRNNEDRDPPPIHSARVGGCPMRVGHTNRFFFVSSPSSWGFPSHWGVPRTEANDNSRVEADDREDFHRLKDMSVPKQRELVTEQALYDAGLSLVPRLGTPPRMRPTDVEIRQFATRKRPASGAGPSRPPKRPAPAALIVEASMTDQSEPVIALAAPAARAEERPVEEAAEGTSAASPATVEPDDVRETEHHPAACVAATGGAGSTSSIPSLPVPSVGAADRGKAPMDPADETRSGSHSVPPSAQFPEGASALADHNLARRLCQGILLPADVESLRSRQVTEMLSKFYPTMVEKPPLTFVERLSLSI
ncbi:uncharacterized protein [Elaeis guineensis]|uniref:uncharacterized protein n=1 Tax=Elaeis guineensis var. tenera TaxID=51953 RepID=UPI003C6DA387